MNYCPQLGASKLKSVEISLSDCLACSGCITSAEGVLINQQNQDEVLRILNENMEAPGELKKTVVVTVSQQAILSIAKKKNLEAEIAMQHISGFFKSLGADYVIDTRIGDDLALIEVRNEFRNRFQNKGFSNFPILTSSCPGFVCYVEKTHGSLIIPHLSTTRSPQQIMGVLVKKYLAEKLGKSSDKFYHITIMPCFDKKLEASREDYFDEVLNSHDVDCVITPIEIEQMLQKLKKDITEYGTQCLDWPWEEVEKGTILLQRHESSGSGGYCEYILKDIMENVLHKNLEDINFKHLTNPDFKEIVIEENGEVLLAVAIANGFRNIQNLVQKIKRKKCKYHFVEVMACPSGCLNGGALLRPENVQLNKTFTGELEQMYNQLPNSNPENEHVHKVLDEFFDKSNSEKIEKLLHTTYHAVEKEKKSALNIKW